MYIKLLYGFVIVSGNFVLLITSEFREILSGLTGGGGGGRIPCLLGHQAT
jgi:hypothetical protein